MPDAVRPAAPSAPGPGPAPGSGPEPGPGLGASAGPGEPHPAAGPAPAAGGPAGPPVPAAAPGAPGASGGLAPTAACAALLLLLAACLAAAVRWGGDFGRTHALLAWYAACWALFAAAVALLRRVPARRVVPLVAAGGLLLAATGLVAPPRTSDDSYRYAWDGGVQAAGVSPYRHAPLDPALAPLRDPWLFPRGTSCRGWDLRRADGVCTRINRPAVHTIYPPVAEGWFAALHLAAPAGARHKTAQVGGLLAACATTGVLLAVLRRRPGPDRRRRAALWAWCPAVPLEAVNNAHVDTVGALLAVAGLGLAAVPPGALRRGAGAGIGTGAGAGVLLGLATAVKLLPGLAAPGVLSGVLRRGASRRRRALLAAGAAVAAFALVYLPYAVSDGAAVLGYLPGYLHEEGYDDGRLHRFGLLRLVLPDAAAQAAAALAVAAAVVLVLLRGDPARPWRGALLVTGTAFLALCPGYPWYGLLVVALVALDGRGEWLAVPGAAAVLYLAHGGPPWLQPSVYGAALAAVVAGAVLRRSGGPGRAGGPPRTGGPDWAGGGPARVV
ncbi:glycosyltransferase 87 family protein [Streptomyces sp. NPDC001380]|uniref:glycosyltransferase 87 family protein n=1 Tax=Streptomyces sp. NPDC001380 TaxID=3364566 RepID=UPI00367E5FF2